MNDLAVCSNTTAGLLEGEIRGVAVGEVCPGHSGVPFRLDPRLHFGSLNDRKLSEGSDFAHVSVFGQGAFETPGRPSGPGYSCTNAED